MVVLSHYLQGFIYPRWLALHGFMYPRWFGISQPSTVRNYLIHCSNGLGLRLRGGSTRHPGNIGRHQGIISPQKSSVMKTVFFSGGGNLSYKYHNDDGDLVAHTVSIILYHHDGTLVV